MAKNLQLKCSVVLGVGDKAKTMPAGSVVKLADELANQLIEARAAVVIDEPKATDMPPAPDQPPVDPTKET